MEKMLLRLSSVPWGMGSGPGFPVETTRVCSVVPKTCPKSFEAGNEIWWYAVKTLHWTPDRPVCWNRFNWSTSTGGHWWNLNEMCTGPSLRSCLAKLCHACRVTPISWRLPCAWKLWFNWWKKYIYSPNHQPKFGAPALCNSRSTTSLRSPISLLEETSGGARPSRHLVDPSNLAGAHSLTLVNLCDAGNISKHLWLNAQ